MPSPTGFLCAVHVCDSLSSARAPDRQGDAVARRAGRAVGRIVEAKMRRRNKKTTRVLAATLLLPSPPPTLHPLPRIGVGFGMSAALCAPVSWLFSRGVLGPRVEKRNESVGFAVILFRLAFAVLRPPAPSPPSCASRAMAHGSSLLCLLLATLFLPVAVSFLYPFLSR